MMVTTEHGLVFEHGFGCIAIIDFRQQSAPGTDRRFQHYRITEFFDCLQRRFLGESDAALGLCHAPVFERSGGE